MANTRKKRARSASAHTIPPQVPPNGTAKGVQTPGEPPAHQMYGTYRTLKMIQLLMQATEKFLEQFSPFLPDECGRQAANLNADIKTNMPIVNAHISRMEGNRTAESADDRGEGGVS